MRYVAEAVKTFFKKENFVYFFKIRAFLLFVAFVMFIWSLILKVGAARLNEGLATGPVLLSLSVAFEIVYVLVYFFVEAASIEAAKRVQQGSLLSVREAFKVAKSRVWKFFLTALLKGLILVAGFLLFLVPGIIFVFWFAFSELEVVLNGLGVKEALVKSKMLVVGRFWKVFGNLCVIGIFEALVQTVLAFLPFNLGILFVPLFGVLFTLSTYLLFRELEARAGR